VTRQHRDGNFCKNTTAHKDGCRDGNTSHHPPFMHVRTTLMFLFLAYFQTIFLTFSVKHAPELHSGAPAYRGRRFVTLTP